MRRLDLPLPWPGVAARLGGFGLPGVESRLTPPMRRVHQSRSARALAIDLLAEQGEVVGEIRKRPGGAPLWPDGFVGSLAHTEGYAAAAVARRGPCVALGIDVEPAQPLPDETGSIVLTDDERRWLARCEATRSEASRLVFCAKECVHKCVHPLRDAWLEFSEVRIEFDSELERFVPVALTPAATRALEGVRAEGRVFVREQHLVTVLALFAPA